MKRILLALASTLALCAAVRAEPVTMSVGSYNLNNLPFPLAVGLGLYKKAGLDVTMQNFASGGSSTLQALIAGSTDISVGFYDHTIQMQAQNKSIVAVTELAANSGLVLAARPDAKFNPADPATIKGERIGITAPGSSSDFFVKYYLDQHHQPQDSVSIIAVGSGSSAVAALQQGRIDLLVNYDPAATIIESKKIGKILIDARSVKGAEAVYGGIYPTSVLYTTPSFIEKHEQTVQKVASATVEALKYIQTHSAADIVAHLPPDFVTGDKATYTQAVENAKAIFSKDGKFDPATLQTPLKVLDSFNPKVKGHKIDISKTYTNKFVDAATTTN